jgi:hypothetical protein
MTTCNDDDDPFDPLFPPAHLDTDTECTYSTSLFTTRSRYLASLDRKGSEKDTSKGPEGPFGFCSIYLGKGEERIVRLPINAVLYYDK